MVPKKIHYCWFGGNDKTNEIKEYIDSWKNNLKDYEIYEWNEETYNIEESCSYVKEAYERKKWAFVTDYVRLDVLYKYGGIYFDTDVKVLKSFDTLLDSKAFICSESEYSVCTAVIGAEKNSIIIKKFLQYYNNMKFVNESGRTNETPNSQLIYKILVDDYNYKTTNKIFMCDNECIIYPADYFSPINCYTRKMSISERTYAIHYYNGSWKNKNSRIKLYIMSMITRIIGEKNRETLKKIIKRNN